MAKEVVKASKQASYTRGVQEIEVRLAEGLAKVYRDYCQEVWAEALNLAGIPAASEWRKAKNIYYPAVIREVPTTLPPLTALTPTSSEQPSITQASLPLTEVSKGPGKTSDQGQGVEVAKGKGTGQGGSRPEDKGKGKGKEVQPLLEVKGPKATLKLKDVTPKAKDAVSKVKDVDSQSKEADPKATNPPVSQPSNKDDPPPAKAQLQDLFLLLIVIFSFSLYVIFLCYGSLPLFIMYFSFVQ